MCWNTSSYSEEELTVPEYPKITAPMRDPAPARTYTPKQHTRRTRAGEADSLSIIADCVDMCTPRSLFENNEQRDEHDSDDDDS